MNNEHEDLSMSEPQSTEMPAKDEALETARKEFAKELLYMKAEFDNTKKRMLREQDQAIKMANEKLINQLLNPLDLMERAISAGKSLKETPEFKNYAIGVEMTHRELVQLLEKNGVEFIGAPGEKFDPIRHEAISQQETSEDKIDTVLEVLQRGCSLQGRLIKPARVVVGRSNGQT